MNPEQKINNVQEKIITNESVQEVVPTEVVSEEDKQANAEKKVQAKIKNDEDIAKKREEIINQMGGQESKEEYPEGHFMNSKMLDKIAQIEAIDSTNLDFRQEYYDKYVNSDEGRTVTKGQEENKKRIEGGRKPRFYDVSIYGRGGWNRYSVDDNGMVRLDRGGTVTSGSEEYKTKIAQKAKELGIKVEGQE